LISFSAPAAKLGQSDFPSITTVSICRPNKPPEAFISSIASNVESTTERSLIAMVPVRECSMPTLITLFCCWQPLINRQLDRKMQIITSKFGLNNCLFVLFLKSNIHIILKINILIIRICIVNNKISIVQDVIFGTK